MEILENMTQGVVVAGFIASAFSYVILKPINTVVNDLKLAIKELREEIKMSERERRMMNDRLIKAEESIKNAHHRIDGIEVKIN